jgi:hypothetical protein
MVLFFLLTTHTLQMGSTLELNRLPGILLALGAHVFFIVVRSQAIDNEDTAVTVSWVTFTWLALAVQTLTSKRPNEGYHAVTE